VRAGIVLLPVLWLGGTAGEESSHAARGPHATRPLAYDEPALRGGTRRVVVRGALPDVEAAPWVLIASRAQAAAGRYEALAQHVASHGCAAFAAARAEGAPEPWLRYADAVGAALWQLRAECGVPESPLHARIDPFRLVLIADGEGAAAAARVAAELPSLRGIVLIDPPVHGPALGWIAGVRAPLLAIATSEGRAERAAAWFNASGAEPGRRWLVEFEIDEARAAAPAAPDSVLESDLRGLVTAFLDVQFNLGAGVAPPFEELAQEGRIDRRVHGAAGALAAGRRERSLQR